VVSPGFNWTLYGFFLYAGLWVAGYTAWALWRNRKDRPGPQSKRN
jgi:hypothetical protein